MRRHVPGLETVYVDRSLPLHQRRLPFQSHRHVQCRLARPVLGVDLREPVYGRFRRRVVVLIRFEGREELRGAKGRRDRERTGVTPKA